MSITIYLNTRFMEVLSDFKYLLAMPNIFCFN